MSKTLLISRGENFKSTSPEGVLLGLGIVFGSETKHDRSEYKDFFTENTYVGTSDTIKCPVFLDHGYYYPHPIGEAVMTKKSTGWETRAELYLDNPIVKQQLPSIMAGGWGYSTGAVGHVVQRRQAKGGTHEITQWVVGEISITKRPAEPTALITEVKSEKFESQKDFYDSLFNSPIEDMTAEYQDSADNGMNPQDQLDQLQEQLSMSNETIAAQSQQITMLLQMLMSAQAKSTDNNLSELKAEIEKLIADAKEDLAKTLPLVATTEVTTPVAEKKEEAPIFTDEEDEPLLAETTELETLKAELESLKSAVEEKDSKVSTLETELNAAKESLTQIRLEKALAPKSKRKI